MRGNRVYILQRHITMNCLLYLHADMESLLSKLTSLMKYANADKIHIYGVNDIKIGLAIKYGDKNV